MWHYLVTDNNTILGKWKSNKKHQLIVCSVPKVNIVAFHIFHILSVVDQCLYLPSL